MKEAFNIDQFTKIFIRRAGLGIEAASFFAL